MDLWLLGKGVKSCLSLKQSSGKFIKKKSFGNSKFLIFTVDFLQPTISVTFSIDFRFKSRFLLSSTFKQLQNHLQIFKVKFLTNKESKTYEIPLYFLFKTRSLTTFKSPSSTFSHSQPFNQSDSNVTYKKETHFQYERP